MTCTHDLASQETACADGMCPQCLAKELSTLKSDYAKLSLLWDELADKAGAVAWSFSKTEPLILARSGDPTADDIKALQMFLRENTLQGRDPHCAHCGVQVAGIPAAHEGGPCPRCGRDNPKWLWR